MLKRGGKMGKADVVVIGAGGSGLVAALTVA
jgi:ribulose 1,5-bisphosphate synthetase/thiazole synthase